MADDFQANVPLVNIPVVDMRSGVMTEVWFSFFVELWRRTGSGGGVIPDELTIGGVLSLEQNFAGANSGPGSLPESTYSIVPNSVFLPENIYSLPKTYSIENTTYVGGVDYTAGVTTSLVLPNTFANGKQLWIYFDGTFQGDDQYSLTGTTLTFTAAIPAGVARVYVKGLL